MHRMEAQRVGKNRPRGDLLVEKRPDLRIKQLRKLPRLPGPQRVLRHPQHSGASGTGMLWVAQYALRPGQTGEFSQLFDTQIRPLFDEQIAAGTILSYSLSFHAVHTEDPGGATIAYLL